MGQNTGRFCIRVRKSEDWLKLHKLSDELIDDLALENDIDEMVELGQLTFVNDGEIVLPDTYHGIVRSPKNGFYDISWFVKKLADIFEQTAIIIADTTYESETTSRVYYLGEELHYQYFESSDLYYSKDIEKLGAWIGEDVFSLSEFELNYLNEFNVKIVLDGVQELDSYDTKSFEIEDNILISYFGSEKDIVVPDVVTQISSSAFSWCERIENITIPDSVTKISEYAFENCYNLKTILIKNPKVRLEGEVLFNCYRIESVTIGSHCMSYIEFVKIMFFAWIKGELSGKTRQKVLPDEKGCIYNTALECSNYGEAKIIMDVSGTKKDNRPQIIEHLSVGETVQLERHPENEHDDNAIEVLDSTQESLGWIPREFTSLLSPLLDWEVANIVSAKVYYVVPQSKLTRRHAPKLNIVLELSFKTGHDIPLYSDFDF